MREWVANVEKLVDDKLQKWKKDSRIENGEAVHLRWQFEQSHIIIDIFWKNHKEHVHFQFIGPRVSNRWEWDGLTEKTFNRIIDRVGNIAQIVMHPPEDYRDG